MAKIEHPLGFSYDLDLGDGHFASWVNQGQYPFQQHIGLIVRHLDPTSPTGYCSCAMWFAQPDGDVQRVQWTRTGDDEHLTASPSLGCPNCSDHGFIRNGKWVRA